MGSDKRKPSVWLAKGVIAAATLLPGLTAGDANAARAPEPVVNKKPEPASTPPAPAIWGAEAHEDEIAALRNAEIAAQHKKVKGLIQILEEERKITNKESTPEEIEKLIRLLGDDSFDQREKAVKDLVAIGNAVRPEVQKAFDDSDLEKATRAKMVIAALDKHVNLQLDCLYGFGQIGEESTDAVPLLITMLTEKGRPELTPEDNAKLKLVVMITLGNIGPKASAAVPGLIASLHNANAEQKLAAVEALGKIGPAAKEAVPELIEELNHTDVCVRGSAAEALGKIGPDAREAVPGLASLLQRDYVGEVKEQRDQISEVKEKCIEALGCIGAKEKGVLPALFNALKDKDAYARGPAVEVLGEMGADAKPAVFKMVDMLKHDEGYSPNEISIRDCVLGAFENLGPDMEGVVPGLNEALKDKELKGYIKMQIADLLSRFGPKAAEAVPGLITMLKNDDSDYRNVACNTLEKIGPDAKGVIPGLVDAMLHGDLIVSRIRAAKVLGKFGTKGMKAIPGLIAGLEDTDWEVRLAVMHSLGEIGPMAKEALPALKEITKSKDTSKWSAKDKEQAAEAINAIDQKTIHKKPDAANGQSRAGQMENPEIPLYRREHLDYQNRILTRAAIKPPVRG